MEAEARRADRCRGGPGRVSAIRRGTAADAGSPHGTAGVAADADRRAGTVVNLIHESRSGGTCCKTTGSSLIGEDIEGPYGGAFKVTKDLSRRFPGRVRNTPISEAAIVGLGNGLALCGLVPVCEIMFGDFLTAGRRPDHQPRREVPLHV